MSEPINPRLLENLPLFKDLTSRQLLEAAALLSLDAKPAGHVLMHRDDPGETIFIIKTGAVKVCADSPEDELSLVHIGGPGEVFGEMSVVDGRSRSATVLTLEPSTLYRVEREDFWTTLWEMPPVPYNLVCLLNRRLRLVTEQMQALKHLDSRGRIVRQLASLFEELGKVAPDSGGQSVLPIVLTPQDLGSLAGVPAVEADQWLSLWKSQGIFSLDNANHLRTSDLNAIR